MNTLIIGIQTEFVKRVICLTIIKTVEIEKKIAYIIQKTTVEFARFPSVTPAKMVILFTSGGEFGHGVQKTPQPSWIFQNPVSERRKALGGRTRMWYNKREMIVKGAYHLEIKYIGGCP